MKPRNRFAKRVRVVAPPPEEGKGAKQHFKDECDINNIMRRFIKTGVLTHVNKHSPAYGDVPSQTYHEAMEVVRHATELFMEVPAMIRKKFGNDPAAFMAFVSDEKNVEEMRKMGLAKPVVERPKDGLDRLGDRIEAVMKGGVTSPAADKSTVST